MTKADKTAALVQRYHELSGLSVTDFSTALSRPYAPVTCADVARWIHGRETPPFRIVLNFRNSPCEDWRRHFSDDIVDVLYPGGFSLVDLRTPCCDNTRHRNANGSMRVSQAHPFVELFREHR